MTGVDLVTLAGGALVRHRLRSLLSLLGVAVGVSAVVLLTSLGEGARRYVAGQFEALGTNLVIILPGRTETTGALPGMVGGVPNDLTLEDAEALLRQVPGARRVVPITIGTETVSRRDRDRQVVVVGATADFVRLRRLEIAAGANLPPLEHHRSAPVALIGATVARELFPGEGALGQVVRVGGWRMRVVGVLAARGTQMGMDVDDVVIVPVATGMRMLDRSSLFRVLIEVGAHAELDPAAERAVAVLAERHGEEDVTVLTEDTVVESLGSILGALTLALAGIAAISLLVAGIGIMNVMLVSVSERTAEVGLLRALGATRPQVLVIFLCEAVLLSGAGGVLGLAVGWGGARALALAYPAFPAAPPTWAVVAALAVSAGSGAVFGVIPARRATRLDPVAALQRR